MFILFLFLFTFSFPFISFPLSFPLSRLASTLLRFVFPFAFRLGFRFGFRLQRPRPCRSCAAALFPRGRFASAALPFPHSRSFVRGLLQFSILYPLPRLNATGHEAILYTPSGAPYALIQTLPPPLLSAAANTCCPALCCAPRKIPLFCLRKISGKSYCFEMPVFQQKPPFPAKNAKIPEFAKFKRWKNTTIAYIFQ